MKAAEQEINYIKNQYQDEGGRGWQLIYQSLFNPMSPSFKSMTNHIKDTQMWQDYLRHLKKKSEKH